MRRAVPLAAVVLVAAAGCGGGAETPQRPGGSDPFAAVERERERSASRPVRAAPRWEAVTTLRGTGDGTQERRAVRISPRAIQWRMRWSCRGARLAATLRGGADDERLIDARCPERGETTGVQTGELDLRVAGEGPWRLTVEQQVDTPLAEPAPPAVREGRAERLAAGRFYSLERRGRGRAALHRLPDGRLLLRLDGFVTAASADLFVWVSRARRPGSSRAALRSRHVELGPLKATAGDQNYVLPRSLRAEDVASVVIWCEPVRIAYAAASLRPG